jgi:uncharacterized protein (UPF0248 family)
MRTTHRLLLQLAHDPRYDIRKAVITYTDRGAPGDLSTTGGDRILRLDPLYIVLLTSEGETCIPYHRVRGITYNGAVLWEKGMKRDSGDSLD